MTTYTMTLKEKSSVTHDVYRLVFDRPDGFEFRSGQCTHWALDRDGWREEDRPFTMTSQPEETDRIEFVIKSYPDHDGVTKEIPDLEPGAQVIADEPDGAITDQGAGVFIAGGAGVTPFIPILRRRPKDDDLAGCTLVLSNKTEKDIILRDEWEAMDGLRCIFTVTEQSDAEVETGMVDRDFLEKHLSDLERPFYICGPREMVDDVRDALKAIGVAEDRIVTENGW